MLWEEWDVRVYQTHDGRAPFSQWLSSLRDRAAAARIRARIARIRLGNLGEYRPVGAGVSELKIDVGPGYRVYFGRDGGRIVILLTGGDKGTQTDDIRKAKGYWTDYWRRRDEAR